MEFGTSTTTITRRENTFSMTITKIKMMFRKISLKVLSSTKICSSFRMRRFSLLLILTRPGTSDIKSEILCISNSINNSWNCLKSNILTPFSLKNFWLDNTPEWDLTKFWWELWNSVISKVISAMLLEANISKYQKPFLPKTRKRQSLFEKHKINR